MSPSQITPLTLAAHQLNDIKNAHLHTLTVATALVERLPFTALSFNITALRRNFRFEWGVLIDVHPVAVSLFPQLVAELDAKQETDVHSSGPREVVRYERLVGSLAGVPFEISAFMGSQRIEAAA